MIYFNHKFSDCISHHHMGKLLSLCSYVTMPDYKLLQCTYGEGCECVCGSVCIAFPVQDQKKCFIILLVYFKLLTVDTKIKYFKYRHAKFICSLLAQYSRYAL